MGTDPSDDTRLPARRDDDHSVWQTGSDEFADLSLSDILLRASQYSAVEDKERHQIAIKVAPPWFRVTMGFLATEHWTSYSQLARLTLAHGIAKLDDKPWIARLRAAYRDASSLAMDSGNRDAFLGLSAVAHYSFVTSAPCHTTLEVMASTAGRLSELANASGVARPQLAVLVISESLLSLRNHRKYRERLQEEVDAFERHVLRRTQHLRLDLDV